MSRGRALTKGNWLTAFSLPVFALGVVLLANPDTIAHVMGFVDPEVVQHMGVCSIVVSMILTIFGCKPLQFQRAAI